MGVAEWVIILVLGSALGGCTWLVTRPGPDHYIDCDRMSASNSVADECWDLDREKKSTSRDYLRDRGKPFEAPPPEPMPTPFRY